MTDKKRKTALELCGSLLKVGDRFKQAQTEQLEGKDLSIARFEALKYLHKAGPKQLNDISKEILVTSANITYVIDSLEKAGFVKRTYSNNDRRVIKAEITKSGKNKVVSILPTYSTKLAAITSCLNAGEHKEIMRLLEKLIV